MTDLSLAQFVAKIGGIRTDGADRGEVARVREVNRYLRGKNSIIRDSGQTADGILADVRGEGYPVSEENLLDLICQDAWAWIDKSDRHRVLRDYDLQDCDIDPFDEYSELGAGIELEAPAIVHCAICGGLAGELETHGEPMCFDCYTWSERLNKKWHSVPIAALPWDIQEIMIESLEIWI